MTDDVNVKFGADTAGANAGIKGVTDGVKNFASDAKEQIGTVTSTFGKLREAMLAIAAIVAGGALFKAVLHKIAGGFPVCYCRGWHSSFTAWTRRSWLLATKR
jgi:hypothetical protein